MNRSILDQLHNMGFTASLPYGKKIEGGRTGGHVKDGGAFYGGGKRTGEGTQLQALYLALA